MGNNNFGCMIKSQPLVTLSFGLYGEKKLNLINVIAFFSDCFPKTRHR